MIPDPGNSPRWVAEPGEPMGRGFEPEHAEPQARPVERAAQDQRVVPQLLGDVGGDPGVGRRGGGENRYAVWKSIEECPNATVVGAEVMAPVGDAMRLVDHEQAAARSELGQHLVAEVGVVEPLRADEKHIDLARRHRLGDLTPLGDVGGVDGGGPYARARGGLDLVAHQREERGDDDGGAVTCPPQQRRGDKVDSRLAEPGALDQEHPAPRGHQGFDCRPLVVAESRPWPGQPAQHLFGFVSHAPLPTRLVRQGRHDLGQIRWIAIDKPRCALDRRDRTRPESPQ
jgi:hypothetical protein